MTVSYTYQLEVENNRLKEENKNLKRLLENEDKK